MQISGNENMVTNYKMTTGKSEKIPETFIRSLKSIFVVLVRRFAAPHHCICIIIASLTLSSSMRCHSPVPSCAMEMQHFLKGFTMARPGILIQSTCAKLTAPRDSLPYIRYVHLHTRATVPVYLHVPLGRFVEADL